MTTKIYDLSAAALDFAAAAKSGPAEHALQSLQFAALRYAESFARACEADMLPPDQDGDYSDCAHG